ncbi:cobalamin/Fe3+-siderophore ABC transporter ATP-binding protein [Hahella sp. CCB-MM4]|uniref:ABC transporter ATP-binding protein n=1 Tax=Hahella sp. (strain CCB-MM4) TaxID=1926491 RepID=UPI000B9A2DFC|nr:ABC transporter ATP-binding protein [Hahella sp. CCB-MM4]OZG75352.1 cobalamin/Fe3+-siderophore ABC transporter ATP-binding protein [Hahella sp. CCB-MM4]
MSRNRELLLNNASFGYRGAPVIADATLRFREGCVTAILGSNGSGKSTLMKGILGLADCLNGQISLDGRDLRQLSDMERARTLAYLEQQADCHWPMPVEKVVELGRYPYRHHRLPAQDLQAIDRAMDIADVKAMAGRKVSQLSGGERTRVMLARALAVDAPILLADEPVAGLDPQHQLSVMQHLRSWSSDGRIVLVVLHDLNLALKYCDESVLVTPDRQLISGPTAQVVNEENVRRAFGVRSLVGSHEGQPYILPWDVESC